jgi:hypothetical protein
MDGTTGINLLFSNGPTDNLYCIESLWYLWLELPFWHWTHGLMHVGSFSDPTVIPPLQEE